MTGFEKVTTKLHEYGSGPLMQGLALMIAQTAYAYMHYARSGFNSLFRYAYVRSGLPITPASSWWVDEDKNPQTKDES